jgi:hypothetical protein
LTLLFKRSLVPKIIDGSKTATRRAKRPNVKKGKTYRIRVNYSGSLRHRIRVTELYKQQLGDMTLGDALKEGFHDISSYRETWEAIYGPWEEDQMVWVVEFTYVGENESFKEKTGG